MICLKDHSQGAEILTDYCAGALDPGRAAKLQAHLAGCAACRDDVERQRKIWDQLDAFGPVEVSPDFDAKLYARIAAEETQPWWAAFIARLPFRSAFIPAAAAAAVLAVALLTWLPARHDPVRQTASSSPAVTEKIDLQQVEQALDDMDLLTPVSRSPRVL